MFAVVCPVSGGGIGERVSDKIAASKRKGLWIGGAIAARLRHVNTKAGHRTGEAETLRTMFQLYRECGSVGALAEELAVKTSWRRSIPSRAAAPSAAVRGRSGAFSQEPLLHRRRGLSGLDPYRRASSSIVPPSKLSRPILPENARA
jgi:hypothetical protein